MASQTSNALGSGGTNNLALGQLSGINKDTACTFEISGTYGGLTAIIEGSNDGTTWDPLAAFRQFDNTYETLSGSGANLSFAVPDNASRAWTVDCRNRSNVRFRIVALGSGAVNTRADSGFFPSGPAVSSVLRTADPAGNSASFLESNFSSSTRSTQAAPNIGFGIGIGPSMVVGESGSVELERALWIHIVEQLRATNRLLNSIFLVLCDMNGESPHEEVAEEAVEG